MKERLGYDEKLSRILKAAAAVFAEKGYHQASVRDISAATQVSLSGLYYYFSSKEELLYLIQRHCFETILDRARKTMDRDLAPEPRLRHLVRGHLAFFLNNMKEMKVLSHESEVLTGEYAREVTALKREYVEIVASTLEELRPGPEGANVRVATLGLFGMMNWIYTWYRPDRDPEAEELADQMLHVFLSGFLAAPLVRPEGEREQVAPKGAGVASIWRRS